MSALRITPGRWRALRGAKNYGIHSADGTRLATVFAYGDEPSKRNIADALAMAAVPELLAALAMAREMIATERQCFADCNVMPELTEVEDPDNFVSIGGALFEQHDADVVAYYDRALAQIDAAIAKATRESSCR